MRGGRLDRRIVIQRKTLSYSDRGSPIESWSTLATRWASIGPLINTEQIAPSELVAKERVEFRIRWDASLRDLSPLDRIIYPADDIGDSPIPTRSMYDVTGVSEIGRHEVLQIQTFRRADT